MSNIVEFPNTETIHYEMDGDAITGVNYKKGLGSAFNNRIVKWRYKIAINNRSSLLVSETMYSSRLNAYNAGLRIIKQLGIKG